jgi:hypothetical protein
VSSRAVEICGNAVDDDCDGKTDEAGCAAPKFDVCASPLEVSASGTFALSAEAAALDYSVSCMSGGARWRDLVVAVAVPKGPSRDVEVVLTTTDGNVALAAASRCGDAASEVACRAGVQGPGRTNVARLRLRSLTPGTYPVYLFTDSRAPLTLVVNYLSPKPAPGNETCGTAHAIAPGAQIVAELTSATSDVTSACGSSYGDLVYTFQLDTARDVRAFAVAKDLFGTPSLSLRGSPCEGAAAEIGCRTGDNTELFRRALPPGRYYLVVASTGPSDVGVLLETSPPSTPPQDESCVGSPHLTANRTTVVDLAGHVDDIQLGCAVGAPDAAYGLYLDAISDVLLLDAISDGDLGAVSLSGVACKPGAPLLCCGSGDASPVRATALEVAAGEYRVVVESALGSPSTVTAFVRPAAAPVLVPFSDACDAPAEIPATGGAFQGNTANAADDWTASCDVGGTGGSPDQMLHLRLAAPSRVVLDARGSAYSEILDIRTGATCPGDEVKGGCSAGYMRDRSFLDLLLPAGDYWIQIDGYQGASGAWKLDVYVTPQ